MFPDLCAQQPGQRTTPQLAAQQGAQVGALLRVSRTVQWWREAARRHNLHLARVAEESLLSAVFLRTFVHWLRHPEVADADLRALLRRQLRGGPLAWLLRA